MFQRDVSLWASPVFNMVQGVFLQTSVWEAALEEKVDALLWNVSQACLLPTMKGLGSLGQSFLFSAQIHFLCRC